MRFKFIYILLAGMLAAGQLSGQILVEGEYFIDDDEQGPGNGTPVTLSVSGDEIYDSISLDVTGLSVGYHWIYIRMKDAEGKWSIARGHKFYVFKDESVNLLQDHPEITGVEYFIDTEPGPGNGTWVATDTPGDTLENDYVLDTDGLSPGYHWLYARARDADGKWSIPIEHKFYVYEDTVINIRRSVSRIERAEYCIDSLVQVGKGTPIPVTPGGEIDTTFQVDATGLERGTHYLLVRVQDSLGAWSLAYAEEFNVVGLNITSNSPICQGSDEGWANVSIEGGKPPFTYLWNDPLQQTDSTATGLSAGTYTVTVTDSEGAVLKKSVAITEYDTIDINITTSDTDCQTSEGSATALASGDHPPFMYYWSSGDTTAFTSGLSSGIYVVTVTDSIGCTNTAVAAINDIGGPEISVTEVKHLSCAGDADGSIDITVSGGTPPYAYSWSNGEAIEDLNNLKAGRYEITVSDAQGCTASRSIKVNQPQPITFSLSSVDADCGMQNGSATVTVTGGAPPYSFLWDGFPEPHNATRTGLGAGVYKVTVTDDSLCQSDLQVAVSEKGAPTVSITSITQSTCGNEDGSITIAVAGGSGTYTYDWRKEGVQVSTDKDLTGVGPGDYSVSVSDGSGCKTYATATIPAELPPTELICLVTVDTITNKNLLVWNKTAGAGIKSYNIYRETTSAGVFDLVKTISADSLSQFIDNIADPAIRAWRYKISALDSCGTESRMSPPHKTMHLTLNLGLGGSVNLIWNHYEGFVPKLNQYKIWRWTASTGWDMIAEVPSNLNSYSDFSVPDEDVWYYVEAEHPTGCTPLKAATLNSTRSNRKTRAQATGIAEKKFIEQYGLRVWPNPGNGIFNLSFRYEEPENLKIKVFDISGKLVYIKEMKNLSDRVEMQLDLSGYEKGIYQLRLETEIGYYNKVLLMQ